MAISLTPNAIVALNNGETNSQPLVQVLDVRQIGTGQSVQERYRLLLSDGCHTQQGMLATQLNEQIKSGLVLKGSIVKLVEYICNTVQQRKIIIILNMEVMQSVFEIIGDPKQVVMKDPPIPSGFTSEASLEAPRTSTMQATAPLLYPQKHADSQIGMSNGTGCTSGQGAYNPIMNGSFEKDCRLIATKSVHAGSFKGHGENCENNVYLATSDPSGPSHLQGKATIGRKSKALTPYQPSLVYTGEGPISKNEAATRLVPIAALNPYQSRWTIKVRVTSKGDIRRFNNAKGEGKVFSFDVLDAEGGEIRLTCFNDVADQFYDKIVVGHIYMISRGSLKPAQRTFNHLKSDWEVFLESTSTVERCIDEDGSIPHQQFDFKPIGDLGSLESNDMVDVVGVVTTINPITTITRKNGAEVQKRTIQLCDASCCSIELTLWGSFCGCEGTELQEMFESGLFPVLAVKGGRISDFGGKSISTVSFSQLLINPNVPQAIETKTWFEKAGKNTVARSISKDIANGPRVDIRKTVSQIKDEGLGRSDKPDWIALRATISFIKTDSFCYAACPLHVDDRQCNKKVVSNSDGTWRCDRCDKTVPECDYRYILSVQVQDYTGVSWITAFQEAGEEITGLPAKDLLAWKENGNPKFRDAVQKLLFTQHVFKLKIKEEPYNDELRLKCTAVKSERVDFAYESKVLVDKIRKISKEPESAVPPAGQLFTGFANGVIPGGLSGSLQVGYTGGFSPHGPGIRNDNGRSDAFSRSACFKCGGAHPAANCPSETVSNQIPAGYGGNGIMGSANPCFRCGQGGHWARDCPTSGVNGSFCRQENYGVYGKVVSYGSRGF